jgi:hypothetical protein
LPKTKFKKVRLETRIQRYPCQKAERPSKIGFQNGNEPKIQFKIQTRGLKMSPYSDFKWIILPLFKKYLHT